VVGLLGLPFEIDLFGFSSSLSQLCMLFSKKVSFMAVDSTKIDRCAMWLHVNKWMDTTKKNAKFFLIDYLQKNKALV
jgi:hypothetical protein